MTENINLQIQDDTAEATLGLWGSASASPLDRGSGENSTNPEAIIARQAWKAGETVLLIQSPGWKLGRSVCNCMNFRLRCGLLTVPRPT